MSGIKLLLKWWAVNQAKTLADVDLRASEIYPALVTFERVTDGDREASIHAAKTICDAARTLQCSFNEALDLAGQVIEEGQKKEGNEHVECDSGDHSAAESGGAET